MRNLCHISFVIETEKAMEIFKKINKEEECNLYGKLQKIELFDDTDEYSILTQYLERKSLNYNEFKKKVFSKQELLNSEYYYFYGGDLWGYPQPEGGYIERCFNTSEICPYCKNGARQIKPIFLKARPPKTKKKLILVNWIFEYIVEDKLVHIINEKKLTGIEFYPIYNFKNGNKIQGWKQLFITNELPPMSKKTNIPEVVEDQNILNEFNLEPLMKCGCGKIGFNVPDKIIYDRSLVDRFCDFNKSYEWLGGGATTYQVKIVSKQFYEIIEKEKIQNVNFIPIKVC